MTPLSLYKKTTKDDKTMIEISRLYFNKTKMVGFINLITNILMVALHVLLSSAKKLPYK